MEIHIYLVNIHSPKWGWIAVDTSVYQAMKQQGKYPSLQPTLKWIIALVTRKLVHYNKNGQKLNSSHAISSLQ